jgi:hypothetical protein
MHGVWAVTFLGGDDNSSIPKRFLDLWDRYFSAIVDQLVTLLASLWAGGTKLCVACVHNHIIYEATIISQTCHSTLEFHVD